MKETQTTPKRVRSLAVAAAVTGAGLALFRRKDLK